MLRKSSLKIGNLPPFRGEGGQTLKIVLNHYPKILIFEKLS
jgi:hypothetical protein